MAAGVSRAEGNHARGSAAHRLIRAGAVLAALAAPLAVLRPERMRPPAPETILLAVPPARAGGGPPLFVAAATDEAVVPAASAPPVPIGIVGRLPGDGRALVRTADGAVHAMALGEAAQGWMLTGIAADRLRFRRGGEEREMVLPIAPTGDDRQPPNQ